MASQLGRTGSRARVRRTRPAHHRGVPGRRAGRQSVGSLDASANLRDARTRHHAVRGRRPRQSPPPLCLQRTARPRLRTSTASDGRSTRAHVASSRRAPRHPPHSPTSRSPAPNVARATIEPNAPNAGRWRSTSVHHAAPSTGSPSTPGTKIAPRHSSASHESRRSAPAQHDVSQLTAALTAGAPRTKKSRSATPCFHFSNVQCTFIAPARTRVRRLRRGELGRCRRLGRSRVGRLRCRRRRLRSL